MDMARELIVGVLGQWASGKTTAARTLVDHLGGEGQVIFISDRVLLGRHVVYHVLQGGESDLVRTVEADGSVRLAGPLAAIWLRPGEELSTVDLSNLLFDIDDDVYDTVPAGSCNWMDTVRLELGRQVLTRAAEGKPIVVEAGFGTNTKPRGENPFCHTVADLFLRLGEAGVEAARVKWILIEASYATRRERNHRRIDCVPDREFDRFAAEGGDLDPDQARHWAEQGTIINRVANDHDDIARFRREITAACDELLAMRR
ncbi:MAG: hypothetical protein JSW55_02350 [Chloroflexota bacterium]|nr:MAG: hypothetical protein JSW55_02350 [Chloroflexota bacterium]